MEFTARFVVGFAVMLFAIQQAAASVDSNTTTVHLRRKRHHEPVFKSSVSASVIDGRSNVKIYPIEHYNVSEEIRYFMQYCLKGSCLVTDPVNNADLLEVRGLVTGQTYVMKLVMVIGKAEIWSFGHEVRVINSSKNFTKTGWFIATTAISSFMLFVLLLVLIIRCCKCNRMGKYPAYENEASHGYVAVEDPEKVALYV